ncbi:MAG: hypothetical protein AMJ64_10190 [Betaproteobacteria bacterium SG8_39]|nr:MAG: hypothetical protein AMJ64_10190 [Betaproteobacteria bacterium SG8_39]
MSEHQKTLKIVTNLDRAAIEAKLGDLHGAAQAAGLADVAALLAGTQGAPRAQLEQVVRAALKALAGVSGQAELKGQLELVELNLPNL